MLVLSSVHFAFSGPLVLLRLVGADWILSQRKEVMVAVSPLSTDAGYSDRGERGGLVRKLGPSTSRRGNCASIRGLSRCKGGGTCWMCPFVSGCPMGLPSFLHPRDTGCSFDSLRKAEGWMGIAPWYSACLACMRFWVQSPVPPLKQTNKPTNQPTNQTN